MADKTYKIQGNIEIRLEDHALKAVATLVPSSGMENDFSVSDIMQVLRARNINSGYTPQGIEKMLTAMQRSGKEPLTMTIAEGIAPENGTPETVDFSTLTVPPEYQSDIERAVSRAGAPVINQVIKEKVKKEKTVVKKGPLPFLPGKEEVVKYTEETERVERVYVDSTVEGFAWAEAGKVVGSVYPIKQGVPGKAVTGDVIPPEQAADPYFYCGTGLERQRAEIRANATGILRWGKNWAEILPFLPHRFLLEPSEDKATLFFEFIPGDPLATPPQPEQIRAKAIEMRYAEAELAGIETIADVIAEALRSRENSRIPLNGSSDASFEIKVTPDGLKATLTIKKGRGSGKPLLLKEVGQAITSKGFKPLNLDKIRNDIMSFYKGPQRELGNYVLCEGKPATHGTERKVECSVRFLDDAASRDLLARCVQQNDALQQLQSSQTFPLDSVEKLGFVDKDQRVFTLSPSTAGAPGMDVFGKVIPAKPSPDPAIRFLENLDKKPNVIISTVKGIFEQRTVDGTLEVRVRPHVDGEVMTVLSPDRMEGILTIFPAEGTGKTIAMDDVLAAAAKANIVKGIEESIVAQAIEAHRTGKLVSEIVFARGLNPREGASSQLRFLIPMASGSNVVIREDGTADYRNQDNITAIKQGTVIAELLAPDSMPEDGWDVTGKAITAKAKAQTEIEIGSNIAKIEKEGKILLTAQVDGELVYDKKRIDVQNAHTIKGNVCLATGNIRFPGSVTITGTVESGFVVFSGNDIKVGEGIEASLLSSEGSIYIKQGVKGMGKAVLRSKNEIVATFVEQARMLAVGNIKIKNSCVQCLVKTNGKLELQSDKGVLLGGTIKCREGLSAQDIGSDRGVATHISFGQDYLIGDQIEISEKELKKFTDESVKLDAVMKEAERSGQRDRLETLRAEKFKLLKFIEKVSLRLFTLREKFEEHVPSEIVVRGTLYPGVVIESHGRTFDLRDPKKNITLVFNPRTGHIEEKPAG